VSEYEREMWEELYAIRGRVDSLEAYAKQVVSELVKMNRTLSTLPGVGGGQSMEGGRLEGEESKSKLSSISDRFKFR